MPLSRKRVSSHLQNTCCNFQLWNMFLNVFSFTAEKQETSWEHFIGYTEISIRAPAGQSLPPPCAVSSLWSAKCNNPEVILQMQNFMFNHRVH